MPWSNITFVLVDNEIMFIGWPNNVPFPAKSEDQKGIRGFDVLNAEMMRALIVAIRDRDLRVLKVPEDELAGKIYRQSFYSGADEFYYSLEKWHTSGHHRQQSQLHIGLFNQRRRDDQKIKHGAECGAQVPATSERHQSVID